jgi:hypothetical protein
MTPGKRTLLVAGGVVLAVIVLWVGVVLGVRLAIGALVDRYTDSGPAPLPRPDVSPAEREALHRRLAAFQESLDGAAPAVPLELSERDINVLIAEVPVLRDRVSVRLDGDRITGQVSIPLNEARVPLLRRWLAGRYVNGAARFRVAVADDRLVVTMESLEVNGHSLPGAFSSGLRELNLLEGVYKDPDAAEWLRRFEAVEVRGGKVVVRVRAGARAAA